MAWFTSRVRRLVSLAVAVLVFSCTPAVTCLVAGLSAEDGARRTCRTRTACAGKGPGMKASRAVCCEEQPYVQAVGGRLPASETGAAAPSFDLEATPAAAPLPSSPLVRRAAPLVLRI